MKKYYCCLFVAIALCLVSCEQNPSPWNPVFEDTGFEYLETSVQQTLEQVDILGNNLKRGNAPEESDLLLKEVRQKLLVLKEYYIPLTIVRKLVYDADRFFYMKDNARARKRLTEAKIIVEKRISSFNRENIDRVFEELVVMMDTCIMHMDEGSKHEFDSLKKLGHKVNLMLVKGELELSGKTLD